MPKLIYIKASEHRDERLNELIDRIRADDTAAYLPFETADELEEQVVGDLATLLAERFDAARAARRRTPDAGRLAATRVPSPYSRTIGREREIADVLELLGRGSTGSSRLIGPGGIGKSRLAIEVAAAAERRCSPTAPPSSRSRTCSSRRCCSRRSPTASASATPATRALEERLALALARPARC